MLKNKMILPVSMCWDFYLSILQFALGRQKVKVEVFALCTSLYVQQSLMLAEDSHGIPTLYLRTWDLPEVIYLLLEMQKTKAHLDRNAQVDRCELPGLV